MVDEIWNSSTGQFDGNNLTTLLQYITGNDDITSLDITSTGSLSDMLTTNTSYVSNGALSSADIRDIQLAAGNTYTNDSDEVVGQDVQVTFGGLTWQVVYLTQDTDENDIVTLWLSSSYQEKWANDELLTDEEGLYYGFVNGSLYSDWSADWVNDWTQDGSSSTYPANMYGTSYIRTVTLNNGTNNVGNQNVYATSGGATVVSSVQDENNVFAMFTMDSVSGSVTEFLVTPSKLAYQETENSVDSASTGDWLINDAYGSPTGSGWWSDENYNYTSKQGYSAWANDFLWIPSMSETGYSTSVTGIWQTSTQQRQNISETSSITSGVGTSANVNNSTTVNNGTWLRSGRAYSAYFTHYLESNGESNDYTEMHVSCAVRPALHLNLNAVATHSTEPVFLEDPTQPNSENNPYLIDTVGKLTYLSDNYTWAADKYFLQTENLDLNNQPWTPINNVANTNAENRRAYFYDGGGHTISNLNVDISSSNYAGLFGVVYAAADNQAYIKNVTITSGTVTGSRYVGAVVGYAYYVDIENCHNTGVAVQGSSGVGGVAGYVGYGKVHNSYNNAAVQGSGNSVGGVLGTAWYTSTVNSHNTASITGVQQVGGVLGRNTISTISGSYNTGNVTGTGNAVGGIAGYNESGTIVNSYNSGVVIGANYVGGVAGTSSFDVIINSYNSGAVTGSLRVGGIAGEHYFGEINNTYNLGDVTGSDYVGGISGYVYGRSTSSTEISSGYNAGAISLDGTISSSNIGGVIGYIENTTNCPAQYVSISWCYYNTDTVGSGVMQAIGFGHGYQVYGLTTLQMQGAQNTNFMYLSNTWWNFTSGSYPTLKYVATVQN